MSTTTCTFQVALVCEYCVVHSLCKNHLSRQYTIYVIIHHVFQGVHHTPFYVLSQSKNSLFSRRLRIVIPEATGKYQAKMDMTPTRRSKRQSEKNTTSECMSFQNKNDKKRKVLEPKGRALLHFEQFNLSDFLKLCIRNMLTHVWFRIIPITTSECDHVSFFDVIKLKIQ